MANVYFCGVEGGATHSIAVLFDSKGNKLSEVKGPCTNHWLVGMQECGKRIKSMVSEGKEKAGLPPYLTLTGLGLCLSGCEQEETNEQLRNTILQMVPPISENVFVASDTVGSIATAKDNGGIVLISGTGSNALLLNPDGSLHGCGGWGYVLGDEGSGWWLAHKSIKVVFDDVDNMEPAPHPTDFVWGVIQEHFKVKERADLLHHCYTGFEKSNFAALCTKLAKGADKGDDLCLWLFERAGEQLAKHIAALVPKVDKSLLEGPGGLTVVCVGSVWKSWSHLRTGFLATIQRCAPSVREVTLLKLQAGMANGAAYLAAKAVDFDLPRDYNRNTCVFFNHRFTVNGIRQHQI